MHGFIHGWMKCIDLCIDASMSQRLSALVLNVWPGITYYESLTLYKFRRVGKVKIKAIKDTNCCQKQVRNCKYCLANYGKN